MKAIDFILIAVIAAVVFFAIRTIIKRKGKCNCGCSDCSNKKNCSKEKKELN